MELEWAAMFLAAWWHDASKGQRAWVVPLETIEWLALLIDDIPVDPDFPYGPAGEVTGDHVLWAMRVALDTEEYQRNIVYFPGTRLRLSEFVWANIGTGVIDANAIARRQFIRQHQGRGSLLDLHVPRDPYGYLPRINHLQAQPGRGNNEEPPPQRRRANEDERQHYHQVQDNLTVQYRE